MSSTAWPSRILASAIAIALLQSSPAGAQTLASAQTYGPAPWWMDQPVIAVTGMVQSELRANRAAFKASYQAVADTIPEATKLAADKVRALGAQLAAYGPEKVRAEFTFEVQPIYQQYRDKDGNLVDNERPDKIDSYQVSASLSVEVRDVSLVERAYGAAISARPSRVEPVEFTVEPDDQARTALYGQAVEDAARRARLSADSAGTRLGAVRLIDPTGRACQTDVLVAGAARYVGNGQSSNYTTVSAERIGVSAAATSAPSPGAAAGDIQMPIQPPLLSLQQTACVVYSLG